MSTEPHSLDVTMTAVEAARFWPRVDKRPNGCWIWTAGSGICGCINGAMKVRC